MVSVTRPTPDASHPSSARRWKACAKYLRDERLRGFLFLAPTLLVVAGLLILPVVNLLRTSFCTQVYLHIDCSFTLVNYIAIFKPSGQTGYLFGILPYPQLETPIYVVLLARSLLISLIATIAVILLAYPMAYFLAFRLVRNKIRWIILITVPFWTSYLLRVFAWKIILGYGGVINSALVGTGIIHEPLELLLYNPFAVIVVLAHAWLAFAVLTIYVSLDKIDRSYLEAATDLGDNRLERFLHITLPLSMPGVLASSLLVFIPTVGDYVTPSLVGGSSGMMLGSAIQSLFGQADNQPLGAAVSVTMMAIVTLLVCLYLKLAGRKAVRREI